MENNPRLVFEKLFGDGSTGAERRGRRQQTRSILDSVMGQVATLQQDLPASDRRPPEPVSSTTCGRSSGGFSARSPRFPMT